METEQGKGKRGEVQQIPVLLSSQPKFNFLCTVHETVTVLCDEGKKNSLKQGAPAKTGSKNQSTTANQ